MDYMIDVVMWGLQKGDRLGIEDQSKLEAYRHMLDYMGQLDGTVKIIPTSDEEQMKKIIKEIVDEQFSDLK